MLYVSSRLFSKVQFDDENDPVLWTELVPSVGLIERFDATRSIWKFWMAGEVFCADNFQTDTFSISKISETEIQPARLTIRTGASYLFIDQDLAAQQTVFTFLSPHQNALESLESLIASLYEPAEPVRLDNLLLTNQHDLSVRTVRYFDRKTGEEVQRTFPKPIRLSKAIRKYSSIASSITRRDLLSLSDISNTGDPSLRGLSIDIDVQMNKASFSIDELVGHSVAEEQVLRDAERTEIDYFFILADRAFKGESLAKAILVKSKKEVVRKLL